MNGWGDANLPISPLAVSKAANITLWVIQVLLCLGFLVAGGLKLAGDAEQVKNFALIGFGQWFRYVTGTIEIVCAIMVLIPRLARIAAMLLACVMICALIAHLTVLGIDPGIIAPPILLAMALVVARFRGQRRP